MGWKVSACRRTLRLFMVWIWPIAHMLICFFCIAHTNTFIIALAYFKCNPFRYGEHGYEMINVTYSGDLLTAYKVTGDQNVPRGEITFQADLSPLKKTRGGKPKKSLQPIKLTESAAKKWGTSQLPRYPGSGSVAEEGFVNQQWMDGQLIMIGDSYFSFAWLPISHQIFFGRPSPELALKMLREAGNTEVMGIGTPPPSIDDDDFAAMRAYVTRCLHETDAHFEDEILEGRSDEFSCIWHNEATEECYFE